MHIWYLMLHYLPCKQKAWRSIANRGNRDTRTQLQWPRIACYYLLMVSTWKFSCLLDPVWWPPLTNDKHMSKLNREDENWMNWYPSFASPILTFIGSSVANDSVTISETNTRTRTLWLRQWLLMPWLVCFSLPPVHLHISFHDENLSIISRRST